MILYTKSGMFLGMGNQELYLLGYEDMEEFRNYHNDVADLFINKAGFIFKFKNFSWIDYTLHSGTPNRRVLLKTKGGREIEASLQIHEIFLDQDLGGAKSCFGVEFISGPLKSESFTPTIAKSVEPIPSYVAPTPAPSFVLEDAPSFTEPVSFFEEKIPEEPVTFSTQEESFESTPSSFSFNTNFVNTPEPTDFKLKFDTTILDEPLSLKTEGTTPEAPKDYRSIDQIEATDFTFDAPLESYPEDNQQDLLRDTTLFVDELKTPSSELSHEPMAFDFSLSADYLGLDISTLAELIEEYIVELDEQMKHIARAITLDDKETALEEITKLKSVARHLHITALYEHFAHLEKSLAYDSDEEILHTLLLVQNAIADFKELVR